MQDILNNLNQWLTSLSKFSLPDWDDLPDLKLYMDQVVTYLERELQDFKSDNDENIITPWMINNYVKGGLVPIPDKKKYSKEHLGYMIAICAIKNVLSINDIKQVFDFSKYISDDPKILYEFIRNSQITALSEITKEANKILNPILDNVYIDDKTSKLLYDYATNLSLEASVKKIIADKILSTITKADELKQKTALELEKQRLELEKIDKEKNLKSKTQKNL